jgi:hypothetical protein
MFDGHFGKSHRSKGIRGNNIVHRDDPRSVLITAMESLAKADPTCGEQY